MSVRGCSIGVSEGAAGLARSLCCLLAVAIVSLGLVGLAEFKAPFHATSPSADVVEVPAPGHQHEAAAGRSCLGASSCWTLTASSTSHVAAVDGPERFGLPLSNQVPMPFHQPPPDQPPRRTA